MASLFGFEFKRVTPEEPPVSFAPQSNDDGAVVVAAGGAYGTFVDLDGTARTESELVAKYREISLQPEIEMAIDDIVNEAITHDVTGRTVDLVLDKLKQPEAVKKKILEEFENILDMLNFGNLSDDLFKRC